MKICYWQIYDFMDLFLMVFDSTKVQFNNKDKPKTYKVDKMLILFNFLFNNYTQKNQAVVKIYIIICFK